VATVSWLTGKQVLKEVYAGRIQITPFNENQLNPNSYDYRLSDKLKIVVPNSDFHGTPCIDPRLPMAFKEVTIPKEGYLLLTENAYLGSTIERFGSRYFASLLTGKSSIGRLFIKNHACAGLVDQGFYNHITLEITAKIPTLIFPNQRFGQVFWFESLGECELYTGKYNEGLNAAEPSRIHQDWNK
jgi:dCTP deaminase